MKNCVGMLLVCLSFVSHAHEFRVGALRIQHPYAPASLSGQSTGAVYFKSIKNEGSLPDELIGARSSVCEWIEIHEVTTSADVMKMRTINQVNLPVGFATSFKHGQTAGRHLMLMGLKKPLKEGDRFPLWLRFKQAGEKEVFVWVQTPRINASERSQQSH